MRLGWSSPSAQSEAQKSESSPLDAPSEGAGDVNMYPVVQAITESIPSIHPSIHPSCEYLSYLSLSLWKMTPTKSHIDSEWKQSVVVVAAVVAAQ
eukprot:4917005-Amphidinium_carterae.1